MFHKECCEQCFSTDYADVLPVTVNGKVTYRIYSRISRKIYDKILT